MKTVCLVPAFSLAVAALMALRASASAQGTITFGNNIPGLVNAPIFGLELGPRGDWQVAKSGNTWNGLPAGGQRYQGAILQDWYVGFWASPYPPERVGRFLNPSPVVVSLGTGANAGYFPTTNITFDFLPPSGTASVQVRVWPKEHPSWSQAYAVSDVGAGASLIFEAPIGGVAAGFRSFSIGILDSQLLTPTLPAVVPEPGSVVLILIAGLVCHAKRRF